MSTAVGPSKPTNDPTAARIAVLSAEPLLSAALVCALNSATTIAFDALELSPHAPELADTDAILVVPRPDPRRLGAMLARLRRQTPSLVIVALSPYRTRLFSLADVVDTTIDMATSVDEALTHLRRVGAHRIGIREPLTPRHLEILNGVARGASPAQLTKELGISMKTMNNHLGAAYRRLGVDNLTHAILRAHQLGLIRL